MNESQRLPIVGKPVKTTRERYLYDGYPRYPAYRLVAWKHVILAADSLRPWIRRGRLIVDMSGLVRDALKEN